MLEASDRRAFPLLVRFAEMRPQNIIQIQDADVVELLAGRRPELEVGTLPHEVRRLLGCSRDTVFLSQESARHILQKHGDHIGAEDLKLLPAIMIMGVWLADSRPTHAVISSTVDGISYKSVIKVTEDRRRTYVKTLHRTSPRQKKTLFRNGSIIRDGWD